MLLAADCSTATQDCPAEKMCTAVGTPDSCPERGQCEPLPAATEIDLSLPVAKGERVFCVNDDFHHPRLHVNNACAPEERFGFALASPAFEAPHVVVASADGVAYFWQDAPAGTSPPAWAHCSVTAEMETTCGSSTPPTFTRNTFTSRRSWSTTVSRSGVASRSESKGTLAVPGRSTSTGAPTEGRPKTEDHR